MKNQSLRVILLILCLVLGAGQWSHAQPRRTGKGPKTALKQAREHMNFEEYQQAIPHLEELLSQEPNNAYYNFWLGKCLFVTYQKNRALKHFELAAASDPNVDPEMHYYYALTLHYNLQYEKAIQEYQTDLNRYATGSENYQEVYNRISQCMYAQKVGQSKEGNLVKITNLGDNINTEFAEHSPVISGDGNTLYFTARRPDCLGAKPEVYYYDEDIYVSHKTGESQWSPAVNISTPVNSKGHDATISLTRDADRLYLYRHKKAGGLYVTDLDSNASKWKEPTPMQRPLNSKYYETTICESADGTKLFFTSNRPGGFGGKDLYMVTRIGESNWSDPQNLGPVINSIFDEDAPYFHPDGRTLYFSSNGSRSIGGYDIFVTEFDSSSGGWLQPLNMGTPVNTPDDDIYFVLSEDGLHGYYSSGKEGGYGEKDIYELKFPYFRYPKRYYAIKVLGLVEDSLTHDTLDALVRLIDANSGQVMDSVLTTSQNRQYQFELESQEKYSLEVVTAGYDPHRETFVAPKLEDEDLFFERNIRLGRSAVVTVPDVPPPPQMPEIMHVYFDFDKSFVRPEGQQELRAAADFLKRNPDLRLKILAHTDWFNTYAYNLELSHRRAHSVEAYLQSLGVSKDRLSVEYKSENRPIASNLNDEGRQFNRRAELHFIQGDEVAFTSVRLRKGVETVRVDHATPKGLPGYDSPDEQTPISMSGDNATQPVASAIASPKTAGSSELQIRNIYFDFDRADLRGESIAELDKLATSMVVHPDWTLTLQGHTDSDGDVQYNEVLSARRCESARGYLLSKGVAPERLRLQAFSENMPVADNSDASGRQLNRRIEFLIVSEDGSLSLASDR